MHEATTIPTLTSDTSENLTAAAKRAESWFGEPFLQPDEDPLQALAPGPPPRRARRRAGRDGGGHTSPSARWKVRYGLMLGLERVLTEDPAHTAAGTELRRHQIDALTGMLAELIASTQRAAEENGNGNGQARTAPSPRPRSTRRPRTTTTQASSTTSASKSKSSPAPDPGAVRRYRFRHPTASGKTIAAAGFVEAARHLGSSS